MKAIKKKIFTIIQIGSNYDIPSRIFDYFIVSVIFLNLFTTLFATFEESKPYTDIIYIVEWGTIIIFLIEYILRVWTADLLYPKLSPQKARIKFVSSFYGIIDLLSFFPFFLPFLFPSGAVAFRMFRVIRILRLFRINAKFDAFNVIIEVLNDKKNQLYSSICMILIMMMASSLCMYSLEHDAQPENFKNAFSGLWWSVSTLLTVGYGDIYPITTMGKIMAIIISFLGVGMVAIPTGIISAGFVEHYTKLKMIESYSEEHDLKFVTSIITANHPWSNTMLKNIIFPPHLLLVMIIRKDDYIVPKGNVTLKEGDTLVIAAERYQYEKEIELKEIHIKEEHDWVGKPIKDLDISRLELIVMVKRKNKTIIPNGSTIIKSGDIVILFSRNTD